MARNTTRQGANFELEVMHYLAGCDCETTYMRPRHIGWRGFGYDVMRSSGSRGKVDVVAVPPPKPGLDVLFIQAKMTNPILSPADRVALQDLALRGRALPLVVSKTVGPGATANARRTRIVFRQLTGPGPRDWEPWAPGEDN